VGMRIRYEFFEREHLLIQEFSGLFSLPFYKKNMGQIYQSLKTKDIKKVLIDFRELIFTDLIDNYPEDFHESLEKVVEYKKQFNKTDNRISEVTLVLWVEKPLPTVIAHIFVSSFAGMDYNYCSTIDKVVDIIGLGPEFNLLEKIENLKNSNSEEENE
jgi:hypothetical protein